MDVADEHSADAKASFEDAYEAHAAAVLRFLARRAGDADAAGELLGDTFLTAWRHWGRRPPEDEMLPWLYGLAGNAVRNHLRSTNRRLALVAKVASTGARLVERDHAEDVSDVDLVLQVLSRLPPRDQEVLRLVAWEGLSSSRDLAAALSTTPAAAAVRLHRARRRFEQLLRLAQAAADGGRQTRPAATPPVIVPSTEELR